MIRVPRRYVAKEKPKDVAPQPPAPTPPAIETPAIIEEIRAQMSKIVKDPQPKPAYEFLVERDTMGLITRVVARPIFH